MSYQQSDAKAPANSPTLPELTSPQYREDLEQYARMRRMQLPHETYIEKALKLLEKGVVQIRCFPGSTTPTFEAFIELAKDLSRTTHSKVARPK